MSSGGFKQLVHCNEVVGIASELPVVVSDEGLLYISFFFDSSLKFRGYWSGVKGVILGGGIVLEHESARSCIITFVLSIDSKAIVIVNDCLTVSGLGIKWKSSRNSIKTHGRPYWLA
jgi:hypothetical protein